MKKKKISKLFLYMLLTISIVVLGYSSYKLITYIQSTIDTNKIIESFDVLIEVNQDNEDDIKVDFNKLKEVNSDTVGWIRVKNTNINYPIVRADNNDYYLERDFNKKRNSGGWIFSDYHNKFDGTDKNIVIFGHAMKNKTMFGSLMNTLKKDWNNDESNRKIQIIVDDKVYIYKIFSVYKIEAEEYYINTKFKDDQEFKTFIKTVKNRSIYKYNEDVSEAKSILTLSTCYDNNNTRLAVHAYLIDVV